MTKQEDDIIKLAREAGFADDKGVVHPAYQLEAFANLVIAYRDYLAAAEREACAKLCEAQGEYGDEQYADAIRARGNT